MAEIDIVFLMIFILAISVISATISFHNGYRESQIDALSGKQEYRLVEFEDGVREYRKESELKNLITHKIIK
jgi:hypothetical protein